MRVATYQPSRILDDVRSVDVSSYREAVDTFLDRFLTGEAAHASVYQFGDIGYPGISDIDLLIVIEDTRWVAAAAKAVRITRSSDLLSYLFVHEPLVVCESLLPHLPALHTLEHCRRIAGDRDPLGEVTAAAVDDASLLVQHVVWGSFMRVAALEMDARVVGLRRALTLLGNLLAGARSANRFLTEPCSVDLSATEIRAQVLAEPSAERAAACRRHIESVVAVLDRVDAALDREMLHGWHRQLPPIPVNGGQPLLFAPGSAGSCGDASWWRRMLLTRVRCLHVPAYLILVTAALCQRIADVFPGLAGPFAAVPVPASVAAVVEESAVPRHMLAARAIYDRWGAPYGLVLPFGHSTRRASAKARLVGALRNRVATSLGVAWGR